MTILSERFHNVENSSYRFDPTGINPPQNINQLGKKSTYHDCIAECNDPTCIYSRNYTNLRERFEKKIFMSLLNKKKISILFYGSFLLYQELNILKLIGNQISEIHLTDYAYKDFIKDNKKEFINAFMEFYKHIISRKLNITIYIHSEPEKLIISSLFRRRFDIICGIDIDYTFGITNNRPIMKEISENTLKIDGIMYLSQHNLDQVDLCQYELDVNGKIKMVRTDDFVKPHYYAKYKFTNIWHKVLNLMNIIGPFALSIASRQYAPISIMSATYGIMALMDKYFFDFQDSVNINIKKIEDIFVGRREIIKE